MKKVKKIILGLSTILLLSANSSIPTSAVTYYNRESAASYARTYAESPNPAYKDWGAEGGDCTNFVSQSLKAGGISTSSTWNSTSWGSCTGAWRDANLFRNYFMNQDYYYTSYSVQQARDNWTPIYNLLWPGDVVQYGSTTYAGHSQIVTGYISRDQYTYVCQHSTIDQYGNRIGYAKSLDLHQYLYGRPGTDRMYIHQIKNGA